MRKDNLTLVGVVVILALLLSVTVAIAHPEDDDGLPHDHSMLDGTRRDPSAPLLARDAALSDVISSGPTAKVTKNLAIAGRGERLVADATTDVWFHNRFAYTGTFNSPCGGEEGAGVWVWDARNRNKVKFVTVIPSPEGSRSNDVKVASLNSGEILVHSNEPCAGGPGGFEIYDVSDPTNPTHLAHVQTDDVNAFLRTALGFVDFGVHNLFLFSQGSRDYVTAVVESEFGNFQIFDITDPANPTLAGFWGSEELRMAELGLDPDTVPDLDGDDFDLILELDAWLFSGFGSSANRFLHDITVTADGMQAYLSNWDAGLVLLDISDPADPSLVSVALDPANGSLDGEVNSHAAWPSEDGTIVVETEEDFASWVTVVPPSNLTFGDVPEDDAPLPGVAISTSAGDDFEASQTGNAGTVDATSLTVITGTLAGNTYPAVELSGDQPKFGDIGPLSGDIVWIGRACNGDVILNAESITPGSIAVVRRGTCTFREKNFNAAAAGAAAIVISNNLTNDTPWGGVRIWDYTDPTNPVLASTFNTTCSAAATPIPACDTAGTYSVHNVIVESTDDGRVKAYFSWYWDGMLVLDVTDPYNPVEVARFFDNSPEFLATNGGRPHDFWGVYKEPDEPWIYGSDRNGGLYIFKELGSGSGK